VQAWRRLNKLAVCAKPNGSGDSMLILILSYQGVKSSQVFRLTATTTDRSTAFCARPVTNSIWPCPTEPMGARRAASGPLSWWCFAWPHSSPRGHALNVPGKLALQSFPQIGHGRETRAAGPDGGLSKLRKLGCPASSGASL